MTGKGNLSLRSVKRFKIKGLTSGGSPPHALFLDQTKKFLETAFYSPRPTLYVFERDNIWQYQVYEKVSFPE